MIAIMQRVRDRMQKPVNWLWVAYAIFAGYLILDGLAYLASPYSGRISRLACEPDPTGETVCTVTIYGIRQVYRRSFPADQFVEALVIHNYTGDSADTTYGITLLLNTAEKINFIHPYQNWDVIQLKAQQVNDLFVDNVPVFTASITFMGVKSSNLLRPLLILLGLFYVLERSRSGKPWPKRTGISRGQKNALWRFAFYWAGTSFLVVALFAFFILTVLAVCGLIDQKGSGIWNMPCFYMPCSGGCLANGFGGAWLCYYALIALLLLKAVVQRQLLTNIGVPVSVWWIIAPAAASIILLATASQLSPNDCTLLTFLLIYFIDYPAMIGLVIYLLCLGLIQYLALRRKLADALAWMIMPLVNIMLPIGIVFIVFQLRYLGGVNHSVLSDLELFYKLTLPALIASELIPALYISWLVNRRNAP